jgi:hypothetical protein
MKAEIKTATILLIATGWVIILLKQKQLNQDKAIKRELVLGTLIDSLQDAHATKDSLIKRWEKHHVRIKEYAIEWDKTHTR